MIKDVVELLCEILCAISMHIDEELHNNFKNFFSCLVGIIYYQQHLLLKNDAHIVQ
jgi:hypothetical protein